MNELKPCPFCGGEASLDYDFNGIGVTYGIHCPECHCAIIDTGTYSKDEAITAWNRRVQPELTRCEKCVYWDKSASFMSAHACAFWSSGKKTRYTENHEFCSFAKKGESQGGAGDE